MSDSEQFNSGDFENQEQDELYEHHRIIVDKGQSLLRIDKFLMNRLEHTSRNRIQQACDAGNILVNGKEIKSSYKVKPGDQIQVVLPEPVREIELIPQNLPINIVFEDHDLVILDKAAGMVVHPAYGNYTGTLMNALVYHFSNLPASEHNLNRPGLIHRIDKNTSGLLVIAKTEKAMTKLAKEFFDRTIERKYLALVWGDFKEDEGTITGNVGRNLKDRKVMDVFPEGDHGKHAVTHYKVIERFGYLTLVECKLETGRTHQIRVHMKYINHPLFNDESYGGNRILKGTTFSKYKQFVENCFEIMPRQALHAKTLGFVHPVNGKKMFFESPLPEDFSTVLEKWRNYIRHKKED
ncbi:MAG: RluA family pseudouridine synthase [Bacteroidetes bacterium]|nr:MAG: RluA family pseudouridine synthase [Bacteroidota bacterium]REK06978.1 MAG: RluA family pseudouridine synthase [Bacteroidota bacterium]REK33674.1 MAG: RluA family pseudouridine synthase [Bacteroidota bacterium]REK47249.1 MAG: RluA family pseudouridine synthase [Bacteroidota bacterium]